MNKNVTGIYIRVSTEDQAKDGFSINAQRDKLTKYADLNDWEIYDYYVDDGISGKNLDARPEVTRLISDIEKGKISNVLIYKLDRLTRSVRDLIYLIELFEKHNCTFNSQTEKIDTSNAVGRMFVKIIGIFAEFERENLAERVSFGYEQKTREGNYTNTNGVYGYDYIKNGKKYIINEEEKELVNKIFDLYINGLSYFRIAKKLNEEHFPTKRGGNWATGTIKSIITNPLYIGKVRYGVGNKNKDKSFIVDGKNIEPIVSEEKWNMANESAKTRQRFRMRRYSSEKSYYFHIIKCSRCSGNILARQQKQNNKLYITYRCQNAIKGLCDCKGFSHKIMENAFLNYLEKLENIEPYEDILEDNEKLNSLKIKQEQLNTKISRLYAKKREIKNEFINEITSFTKYEEIILEIDKKILWFNNSLLNIKNQIEEISNKFTYDEIKDLIGSLKLNWTFLNDKEKQLFLEKFVNKIKIDKRDNKLVIEEVIFKNV